MTRRAREVVERVFYGREECEPRMTWDGDDYQRRFDALAASGMDVHGEADFVMRFAPATVLDAGCGTGRVAVELARRGCTVVGVDADASMLATARARGSDVEWRARRPHRLRPRPVVRRRRDGGQRPALHASRYPGRTRRRLRPPRRRARRLSSPASSWAAGIRSRTTTRTAARPGSSSPTATRPGTGTSSPTRPATRSRCTARRADPPGFEPPESEPRG